MLLCSGALFGFVWVVTFCPVLPFILKSLSSSTALRSATKHGKKDHPHAQWDPQVPDYMGNWQPPWVGGGGGAVVTTQPTGAGGVCVCVCVSECECVCVCVCVQRGGYACHA